MEAKEKAKELIEKYFYLFSVKLENTIANYEAKQCALIAVNEISKAVESDWSFMERKQNFWQQVKIEIENL